jgi:transcriptional regulator with XRE-family HTH domain/Zn-dependent peptidase ImmA (M78 family)
MEAVSSWTEIGERVRESRIALGLTQAELAERIGLERSMIAKVEAGGRQLDALELFRLADVLGLPLGHFLRRPVPTVVSRRASLTEDTATSAARDQYLMQAELESWLHDVRQLVDLDLLRPADVFRYESSAADREMAREAATHARSRLGIEWGPVGAISEACAELGQFVRVADIRGDGASLLDGKVSVALVSADVQPGRRRGTAAHELGHQVLGDEYSSDLGVHTSRSEREAVVDAFAAEFLLPTVALRELWPAGRDEVSCRRAAVRIAAEYRVSWSLLLRQAEQLGVLPESWRPRWRSQAPTRADLLEAAGTTPQPDLDRHQLPLVYTRAVLAAYRRLVIGPGRAVELLHGQIDEDELPLIEEPEPEP